MAKSRKIIFAVSLMAIVSFGSVSWGQSGFGGFRRSASDKTIGFSSSIKNFHGDTGSSYLRSSGSAFQSRSFSQSDLLTSSTGSSLSNGRKGSFSGGLNFGSVSLSSGNLMGSNGGLSKSSAGLWKGGSSVGTLSTRSMPQIGTLGITSGAMFGDADPIILLPEQEETIEDSYRREWEKSAQAAILPFQEKELLRPNPNASVVMDLVIEGSDDEQDPMAVSFLQTEKLGLTTSQGSLYTAQQISLARKYVRQGKFAQALNCYQAARSVDPQNKNALIGIALSHIMTGKLQAGGVSVSFLADQHPDFWKTEPDFMAIFGTPASKILPKVDRIAPELDHYLSTYRASDSREMAKNVCLANLSKMFLAWLRGDQAGMEAGVQAAAEASPLDAQVQCLCREMVGGKSRPTFTFQPLEPLE